MAPAHPAMQMTAVLLYVKVTEEHSGIKGGMCEGSDIPLSTFKQAGAPPLALLSDSNALKSHAVQSSIAIMLLILRALVPHRVYLAWWVSRTVYVPGNLGFEPRRMRGFFGFPGVQVSSHQCVRYLHRDTWQVSCLSMGS